jgi:hypothetical protein
VYVHALVVSPQGDEDPPRWKSLKDRHEKGLDITDDTTFSLLCHVDLSKLAQQFEVDLSGKRAGREMISQLLWMFFFITFLIVRQRY